MSVDWVTYHCLLGMAQDGSYASKYLTSDHHVDRVAFAKIDYRNRTGNVYLEPSERGHLNMARGRRDSFDSGSLIVSTRRREASPEYDAFGASRKAYRISSDADNDASDLSKKSRDRDRKLLNDITQRLNRIEYDGVKAGKDVTSKTGFRRMLYNRTYIPIEKATREKRRKDELRYPWDNTITDNVFRGVKQRDMKISKRLRKKTDKKDKDTETKEYSELPEDLPEYDPMGVYRPRPKREHKKLEDYSPAEKKYETKDVRLLLAQTRAKVEAMPRQRDTQKDVDAIIRDITRPLPKNDMSNLPIHTVDGYYEYDEEMKREGLDEHLKRKVKASQSDLDELEQLLNSRFGSSKGLRVPSLVSRFPTTSSFQFDERELGLEPSFDEPTVIHHRPARPIIRAGPAPIRRHVARPVHASPRVRVRSSSVPASPRTVPRNKSRIADIEARVEAEAYTKSPPTIPLSELRARTSEAKNKLDTHKAMMDRYLPIYLGPENAVEYEVDYKYGELVDRMPSLDPYRPRMGYSADMSNPSVAPYKPVNRVSPNPGKYNVTPRGNFRPHVSETRRRIRDVICASRKDPHYFE